MKNTPVEITQAVAIATLDRLCQDPLLMTECLASLPAPRMTAGEYDVYVVAHHRATGHIAELVEGDAALEMPESPVLHHLASEAVGDDVLEYHVVRTQPGKYLVEEAWSVTRVWTPLGMHERVMCASTGSFGVDWEMLPDAVHEAVLEAHGHRYPSYPLSV